MAQARLGLLVEACPSERIDPAESALDRMGRITEDVLWPARRGKGIGAAGAVDLQGAARSAWEMSGTGMGDRLAPAAGPRRTATPTHRSLGPRWPWPRWQARDTSLYVRVMTVRYTEMV